VAVFQVGAKTSTAPRPTLIGPTISEIFSGPFYRILGASFQPRPNDAVECVRIAEVIFLRKIKLFGLFRPISSIMSGMRIAPCFFGTGRLRVRSGNSMVQRGNPNPFGSDQKSLPRSRRRGVKIQMLLMPVCLRSFEHTDRSMKTRHMLTCTKAGHNFLFDLRRRHRGEKSRCCPFVTTVSNSGFSRSVCFETDRRHTGQLEHLNLHTATARPMAEIFDLSQKDWDFHAEPSSS